MKNKKLINKKVSSEIGIGIILFIALVIYGAFYFEEKKEQHLTEAPAIKESPLQDQRVSAPQQNSVPINNQQNQTANVGTQTNKYTNKTYGFEFDYPQNSVVNNDSTDDNVVITSINSSHWSFNVKTTGNDSMDKDFDNYLLSDRTTGKKFKTDIANINIGGISAKQYSMENYSDYGNTWVTIYHGKNIIRIFGDNS